MIRFLLKRSLFPGKQGLVELALWVAIAGVTLGILQLVVVLSVMSGFQKVFRENYTRFTSEVVVLPRLEEGEDERIRSLIATTRGVAALTPFRLGQAMLLKDGVAGVMLEGMDRESAARVTPWDDIWLKRAPELEKLNPNWIWIGSQLAEKLGVTVGDEVQVLFPEGSERKVLPFVVSAITKFGIYDHDLHYSRIDLKKLEELFDQSDTIPMYKLKLNAGEDASQVAERLRSKLGERATVREWNQINPNIFLAVEHQKGMLMLVLVIVVALAAVNVVNLILMSSHHRRRDMAILRAMGMRARTVLFYFLAQGVVVGMAGVVLGLLLGIGFCELLRRYQPVELSEAIYNVKRLPVDILPTDLIVIAITALSICVIFSFFPALRAAGKRPVEALRYE